MTTAQYREDAMNAEAAANWQEAARNWEMAIANYPAKGALATLDITKMQQRLVAAKAMA